jgi:signal transduction histidine kinase
LALLKDVKFTSYTAAEGLAGNQVRTIHEDADGTLWIGTYDDGLSRFRDGKFFNSRMENGLFNNGVFQILEDRRGYFWISCNKGIYRVSRRELNELAEGRISRINSVAFGKDDGMINTECNGGRQPAGFIAQDGKLWFPTMGGVVAIDPEAAPVNSLPPPVVIESVTLERGLVDFSFQPRGVTVAPGQRELEINYTGLSLIRSEQVKFKYKLEGLDTDWVDVGTRRVAYFPYLSPGSYTFRVIAANSDGVWNNNGAALRIVVKAPFYLTVWFLTLVVLGVAGLGYLAYRSRIAQLQRRQEEQAAFSRRLIESQEGERKRIAAELHDGLGQSLLVIKNRALVGGMSPEDARMSKEQFDEISLTASQAIEEARRIAYDLRPYHLDRLGLTQSLEEMVERVAALTPIRFTVNLPLLDGVFTKEGEAIFYRIVQESVSNILKHSQATEALVAIRREEDSITLTVRDNGKGFPMAQVESRSADHGLKKVVALSDSPNPQASGFGLIGLAERVRMLNGIYTLESAPNQGTAITVRFPVR